MEEDLQLQEGEMDESELTDDELAAALGFATSLGEASMPQPDPMSELQEEGEEELDDDDSVGSRDGEQDQDIAELERRILMLENQVETDGQNTNTPGIEA